MDRKQTIVRQQGNLFEKDEKSSTPVHNTCNHLRLNLSTKNIQKTEGTQKQGIVMQATLRK